MDLPFPRAVELAKEDRLQLAERKLTVLQGNRYGRGGERRADVRPRIAVALLGVSPVPRFVDQSFKRRLDVYGDFARAHAACLEDDAGGGVRHEENDRPPILFLQRLAHPRRNVDKLCAAVRMHDERPHRRGQRTLYS
jgi:hypothetical protein